MAESCTGQETTGADAPEVALDGRRLEFVRLIVEYHNARAALIDFLDKESYNSGGSLRATLHSLGADPRE